MNMKLICLLTAFYQLKERYVKPILDELLFTLYSLIGMSTYENKAYYAFQNENPLTGKQMTINDILINAV